MSQDLKEIEESDEKIESKNIIPLAEHHKKHRMRLATIFILIIVAMGVPAYLTGSITGAAVTNVSHAQITGTILVLFSVIFFVTALFSHAHTTKVAELPEDVVDHAQQLRNFIVDARGAGESKETIIRTLIASGWPKKIVLSYVNHSLGDDLSDHKHAKPKSPPQDIDVIPTLSASRFDTHTPLPRRATMSFIKSASLRGFTKNEIKKALVDKGFPKNEAKRIVNHVYKKNKKVLKHKHNWSEKPVAKTDLKYLNDELAKLDAQKE